MQLEPLTLLVFAGMSAAHCTMQYAFVGDQENNDSIEREEMLRYQAHFAAGTDTCQNPIQDVTSPLMACNVNGDTPAPATADAAAGSSLTLEWHHEGRDTEAIAASHKGPVLTYMAAVDSAASATSPADLDWFKVDEAGLDGQTWAVDTLIANNGKWTFDIPAAVPDGEYLVRQEIIALHSAYSQGGAQFYIGCAQIAVTGGGSGSPSTVKIPGVYPADDPGIVLDIYNQNGEPYPESYPIPGPPVFEG